MVESAYQAKKKDLNYYLIISNLGWFLLLCEIYKMQTRISCLQGQFLGNLSLVIKKKRIKIKNKTRLKIFL